MFDEISVFEEILYLVLGSMKISVNLCKVLLAPPGAPSNRPGTVSMAEAHPASLLYMSLLF